MDHPINAPSGMQIIQCSENHLTVVEISTTADDEAHQNLSFLILCSSSHSTDPLAYSRLAFGPLIASTGPPAPLVGENLYYIVY